MQKDTLIKVRNTTNSRVGYVIPDLGNYHRNFMPGETKEISFEELQKLSFIPGGEVLLREHLMIEDPEALQLILDNVEPEYFYTEDDVKELLASGTLEQFMDFLDFAPEGLINLAKDLAVSTEVNDVKKREAILKKTGFNVTKAIEINHETAPEEKKEEKVRRTTPITQAATAESTGRRTAPPKYKVTVKQD